MNTASLRCVVGQKPRPTQLSTPRSIASSPPLPRSSHPRPSCPSHRSQCPQSSCSLESSPPHPVLPETLHIARDDPHPSQSDSATAPRLPAAPADHPPA